MSFHEFFLFLYLSKSTIIHVVKFLSLPLFVFQFHHQNLDWGLYCFRALGTALLEVSPWEGSSSFHECHAPKAEGTPVEWDALAWHPGPPRSEQNFLCRRIFNSHRWRMCSYQQWELSSALMTVKPGESPSGPNQSPNLGIAEVFTVTWTSSRKAWWSKISEFIDEEKGPPHCSWRVPGLVTREEFTAAPQEQLCKQCWGFWSYCVKGSDVYNWGNRGNIFWSIYFLIESCFFFLKWNLRMLSKGTEQVYIWGRNKIKTNYG